MKKTSVKRLFNAIQADDRPTLDGILDGDPSAMETVGEHNRLVRDKTPLMFAMQCSNLPLAHYLLDRGADASAAMPAEPGLSVLGLCMKFAYCDRRAHDEWIQLAERLLGLGADPNSGIWPALHGFGGIVDRADSERAIDKSFDRVLIFDAAT